MGNAVSAPLREAQKESIMRQQLANLRQIKQQRDMMISAQIAATRERLYWLAAFATTVVSASVLRSLKMKTVSPLPLVNIPPILFTFAFAYQADFAYGSKPDRLNDMAKGIREKESYWFNQPMELPITLQDSYNKMMAETNAMLLAAGRNPANDWAKPF